MKTSIIILTHNNLSLTKACIQSIEEHTEGYELILVDNGSTDGTDKYIQSLSHVKCIINKENLGFAKGCNQGVAASTGELILFLNNDTVVTRDWLTNMIAVFHQDPQIGMVGPVSTNVSGVQRVSAATEESLDQKNVEGSDTFIYAHRLAGFCLLIKRSVMDAIGTFDEQFESGSCEDDDLCYRALEQGYRLAVAKNVYIHHVSHASFIANRVDRAKIQNENLTKLISKWGINYFPYLDSRIRLNMFVNNVPNKAAKILDVGCGMGVFGLELLNRNKFIELWGVEENPLLAKLCTPYYTSVHSFESLGSLTESFDLILIQSTVGDLDKEKILNALQWEKTAQPTQSRGPEGEKSIFLYLSDLTYENVLPIIKKEESAKSPYLNKLGELFPAQEFDVNTLLKKSIKPTEEAIFIISKLITTIESSGIDGEIVSEWRLESSDEFAQYKDLFDQIFQYDLFITVGHKVHRDHPDLADEHVVHYS